MGMDYVSDNGVERAGRSIGQPCNDKCYCECKKNFDKYEREKIHKTFWQLTKAEKHDFYGKYVERVKIKRKRVKIGSKRECSFQYFFPLDDKRLQVCQKFFRNTLGIRDGIVYRYFRKLIKVESNTSNSAEEYIDSN